MLPSEAVDELISHPKHPALHLCMHSLVNLFGSQSRNLLPSGLDERMKTVATSLEPFLEEFYLSLVALFLGNGGH